MLILVPKGFKLLVFVLLFCYLKCLCEESLPFLDDSRLRMLCFDKLLGDVVESLHTFPLRLNLRLNQTVLLKQIFNIKEMLAIIFRSHSSLKQSAS